MKTSCLQFMLGALLAAVPMVHSVTVNTYWAKVPTGALSGGYLNVGLAGITPANIAAVTTIIHSDPNTSGKIEVDRLDRITFGEGAMPVTATNYMGRGGNIEVDPSTSNIKMNFGPPNNQSPVNPTWKRNRFLQGLHISGSAPRGWVKVDYVGNPVNAPQPYAMKTKVIGIDSWNLSATLDKSISLANLGVPMNRVTSFTATILTDDGLHISDFIRGPLGKGGIAVLTDKISPATAILKVGNAAFSGEHFPADFDNPYVRRGFLTIDYMAAACGEGGSGFSRNFIGFTPHATNDCHGSYTAGNSTFHVVQTQGKDIWNSSDNFAFINKSKNTSDITIKARVDKIENTNSWARAGIMIRAGLSPTARNVAMVVTPRPGPGMGGNGVSFSVRTGDPGTTRESSPNDFSAPYWVLIQKAGNTFKGYMSTTGTGTPATNPGSWTQVGATETVSFPGTYYVGLCQTAGNNTGGILNTSSYSGLNF